MRRWFRRLACFFTHHTFDAPATRYGKNIPPEMIPAEGDTAEERLHKLRAYLQLTCTRCGATHP